jgi:acyl-coenzyme A synthetase/AMP-(fatty) acid ligase
MLSCIAPYAREVLAMTADDRTFAVPRLFFSYGLGSCLYLPLWCGASTVLVEARPDPAEVLRLLRQLRPTLFFSVPTSFAALLRELDRSGGDLGSLRLAVSAGEPLSAGLYARWIETTGLECLDGLGATEVGYIFVSNRPGAVRPGSSGRLLPGYRARVADATGGEVPAGTAGDLWVAGESVGKAYWNKPGETREAFRGEWYRTGDVYTVDGDGYFFYQGRRDDLLRVGANWVSPLEVEACLASHPAVAECAVVGVRDADGLEKPRAFVVLAPGVEPTGIEPALQAHARARLAGFKVPRAIVVVDALPKTATGKIQRYRLRQG